MQELVNWYWKHGVKRGYSADDPDRELRRISIGGWLDPIVKILDRNDAIHSNAKAKACLALWGPSQTGKSTMISRYVDGILDDGGDSALTWSENHKTRFSPPSGGIDFLQSIAPDTLVFNPYNHKSDASGVATRYTLRSEGDGVNPDFPIELKFTTRAQIIQSLSQGYLSECEPIGEHFVFTQEQFMDEVAEGEPCGGTREAYWLLKDIANVLECMKGDPRFNNLFKRGEWDKKIRKALVSSPALLANQSAAEDFMAKIFWDSAEVLTRFYKEAVRMLEQLQKEWEGCRVFTSMEVGALLLDIDSFKSFVAFDGERSRKISEKVSQLAYEKSGEEVHIFLKSGGSSIAGDAFGYFQAICAELVVPLRKENLENNPLKNSFLELAEKCDFLDFPGVSNKNVGKNIEEGNTLLVDLAHANPADIFTKVFKQGKTQCFVYNYVKKYGIDAFAILVRTDLYPSQSSLLSAGVREWLCSFNPNWAPGRAADMPVFVDMTFFAGLINSVAMNGIGNGLTPYVERIQDLSFARKESAQFFATTYHQFPDGKIDNPEQQELTISSIMKDPVFSSSTGLTEENLRAVYSSDGGLDYMFTNMTQKINTARRLDLCRSILVRDHADFQRLVSSQLPSDEDNASDQRKEKLRECLKSMEAALWQIEEDDDASEYRKCASCIKGLLTASHTIFDPIPQNASDMSKKEIKAFIKSQIAKWFDYKVANLDDYDFLSMEQKQIILTALRDSIDEEGLFRLLKSNLGGISSRITADAARYPFALAFGNLLQAGVVSRSDDETAVGERNPAILTQFIQAQIDKDSEKEGSPYYHRILKPFLAKLEFLADNAKTGKRPPQEGDAELSEIFGRIEASQIFQIL